MKKSIKFLLLSIAGILLASCTGMTTQPEYRLSDLQGLWQQNDKHVFVRFTTEQSDESGYLYGREWDEAEWEDDGSYEDFLIEQREKQGHPGNGWFKYKFETTGNLTEIHLMDNGGAEIPKIYVVSLLTETDLVYYEKDYKNIKYNFSKVVEQR